jgi:putative DNA primase/helicase
MPFINENSYGLVRRMLFIVFGETIGKDEKDVHLATKIIQKESAVVLNWILEGLKRLKENKGFSPCKSSDEFLEEFRRHIDSVVAFIEEKNYVPSTDESQGIVGRQALYDEYKMFCSSNGYKNHVHISKFKKRLEGMGFKGDKDRNGRYFLMHKVDYNENFKI